MEYTRLDATGLRISAAPRLHELRPSEHRCLLSDAGCRQLLNILEIYSTNSNNNRGFV